MKRSLLLVVLALLCIDTASAQTRIEKTWGAKGYDAAFSTAATNDGGYIMSGLTISGADKVEGDIVVIKVNAHADTMWTLQQGGPKLEGGNYVMQTSDGGYLVCGHTEDFGASDCDAFLMKLDKNGTRRWIKVYGADLDDIGNGVIELPGEGYVFAGITENYGAGPDDQRNAWFVKTSLTGELVWQKGYGGAGREYAYSIVHMPQGGFLAAGFSNSWSGNGTENAWLLHLDEGGDTISTQLYRTAGNSRFGQIIPLRNGGYLLAGYTHTSAQDSSQGFAVKLDGTGKELWEKTYGTGADGIALYSVAERPDGNLMFTGVSHKQDGAGTAYLLTTDASGSVMAEQHAGAGTSYANSIAVHDNGSYLIAGMVRSMDPDGDLYYMTRDASIAGIPEIHATQPIVYPNPASNTLRIILPAKLANQAALVSITDVSGRLVCTEANDAGKDILVDCKGLPGGIYTYRIIGGEGTKFSGTFTVE